MPSKPYKIKSRRTTIEFSSLGLDKSIHHLGRYNLRHAEAGLIEHVHKGAMEICYLAKGRQMYRVNERDYAIGSNDIFVTFPDEQHSTGKHPEEKGILYWMILYLPPKENRFLGFDRKQATPLIQRLLGMPRRCFPASDHLRELLDAIFAAYYRPSPESKHVLVASRIVEFLVAVTDYAYHPPADTTSDDINSVLAYIDAHPDIETSVPQLAERMNLSESWFKVKFRKYVGMPPAEYILRKKIDHAKVLLASGEKTITQIAYDLGFSSSGYFATVFKRYTGDQPSNYRT